MDLDTKALQIRQRRLLPFLRRGVVSSADVDELFELLEVCLDVDAVLLNEGHDLRRWVRDHAVPEGWKRDHIRLRHEDPGAPLLATSPVGMWWLYNRDITAADRPKEIFSCFHSHGLTDAAVVRVYTPLRDDVTLVLYRAGRRFDADTAALLELYYPHLAGALATRRALDVLGLAESASSGPSSSASPPPSVTVSFPGGAVEAGYGARRCIERVVGRVTTSHGWPRALRAIANAARRFTLAHVGGRSQVLWPGLRIDFAVLPPRAGEAMRLIGYLIEDAYEAAAAESPPLVAAMLSPRELEIARDFASGMSVSTIAEARRIGPETARSHLRAAYRKLEVSSRAQLTEALRSDGRSGSG